MKVFVAGANGAIGRPLLRRLGEAGHEVVGMTRSNEHVVRAAGAEPVVADAYEKAKRELGWQPQYPSWRDGIKAELG